MFLGECSDSFLLKTIRTKDKFSCLQKCQENKKENCSWITFAPDAHCLLLAECGNLNETLCPTCISGQKECLIPKPNCLVNGDCEGMKYFFRNCKINFQHLHIFFNA